LKLIIQSLHVLVYELRGCCGRDCMVIGSTSTFAINAYHHY
jgi:hypothetical protein